MQAFLGGLAEENVGSLDGHLVVGAGVHHAGHFFAQTLLQHAAAGVGAVLGDEGIDFVLRERGENLDVALCLFIAHVEPELVELIGRGALRVEPHVALLGLAELLAVGLCDERAGEGVSVGIGAKLAADEFRASCDVAPLVGTAHLQAAAFFLIEMEKVVALKQLIGELCE